MLRYLGMANVGSFISSHKLRIFTHFAGSLQEGKVSFAADLHNWQAEKLENEEYVFAVFSINRLLSLKQWEIARTQLSYVVCQCIKDVIEPSLKLTIMQEQL